MSAVLIVLGGCGGSVYGVLTCVVVVSSNTPPQCDTVVTLSLVPNDGAQQGLGVAPW